MSRVDLQDPEQLVEAQRELLEAVREAERIVTRSRIGLTQLMDEAARRVAALASMDPPPAELLAAAIRLEAEIRGQGSELLATIVRAAAEIRSRGTDGAGFLARYHDRLTGARSGYTARANTSPVAGPVPSGRTEAGASGQNREAAISAAREAVESAFESTGQGVNELTPEEMDAVRRYTSDRRVHGWGDRWYEIGNALLRSARGGAPQQRVTLKDLEEFEGVGQDTAGIVLVISALTKLPMKSGTVHRGIDTQGWTGDERAAFLKHFVPGGTYRENGFFSGSWKEDVADTHAGKQGIILHARVTSARSVESFSEHPWEHEAMLLPFADFRVRRMRESGSVTHVWIDEIGR